MSSPSIQERVPLEHGSDLDELSPFPAHGGGVKGGGMLGQEGVDAQRLCPLKCQGKMSSK